MKKLSLIFIILIVIFLIVGGFLIFRQLGISKLDQAFNRIQDIKSIKYDFSIYTRGNLLSKQTVWKKGTGNEMKVKIAMNDGMILVYDFTKSLGYAYTPDNNKAKEFKVTGQPEEFSAEGTETAFLNEAKTIKEGNLLFVSKGKLDGKDCLILYFLGSEGLAKHWIWDSYGISIKTNTKSTELKRENIEVNVDIPDDIFELPAGVEITPS
jgi:outer membrane lipoprotein-sorting protein